MSGPDEPTPLEEALLRDSIWRMVEHQYEDAVRRSPRPFVIPLPHDTTPSTQGMKR